MKLIIDIEKDYYEILKYNVEHEQNYKPWNIIANGIPYEERPQGGWGKWIVSEIRCPECLEYFDADCYSKEELKKCPNCGANLRKGEKE